MGWLVIGFKLVPLIIGAVQAVERLVSGAKGKDKQDAAVDMVGAMLATIEGATGRELLDDAAVQEATRQVIDAVVALQNCIAKRAAK